METPEPVEQVAYHKVVIGTSVLLVKNRELADMLGSSVLDDETSVVVEPNVTRFGEVPSGKPDARSFGWAFTLGSRALMASADAEISDILDHDYEVHKKQMMAALRQARNELLRNGVPAKVWTPRP